MLANMTSEIIIFNRKNLIKIDKGLHKWIDYNFIRIAKHLT